ncbi:hypothetical protein ABB37_04659 [Leptomonas pyrrhocoris]|uniref:Cytochrome b5 heme-binding domain-containing protein n=1 Tax=Leptomonas pyrrhocoris TaxID=157538 RepID=A0A0M9G1N5_LEPPY|nr:hypothetical protein ABB37_04659 [Leptomonas pyrrhocoris]XP_015658862.1 hypothetical protein ABB37_04659 [Leptomonas pyrrhocoris]KPA80422.1 hypothetical protein ABB37_04659 [Leptomonas pyrrhocoris]KPA80423.1 hypothetical protein ABB37_04659 [Leptomonas pyrrhocoris]|eukprot:XP_015658861.1 hypothetical protein ABB37_04659 [Leptomonas pyrrhocoris]
MFTQLLQLTGLAQKWPTFTREEVSKHNTTDSLWVVIDNSVFDITPILGQHPGGKCALLKRGGGVKDCAEDMMFHSRAARQDAKKYKIGELSPYDAPVSSPLSPASPFPSKRFASSVPSISKVVITSDTEDMQEDGTGSAHWDSAVKDHPLSSSDSDIHFVSEDSILRADLVK